MNRKIKIALGIILAVIAISAIFAAYYVNDYSHAEKTATDCLNASGNVSVVESSNGLFFDGPGNDTALIFYPGGKVEYTAYAPLLMNLSSEGIDCYLVEMPFNLAILAPDSADEIIDDGNYSHYFISGHSLGGVMASSYVNSTNKTDGLILLAAYPTGEIEKPVLSIYGSEDGVLNMQKYNESLVFMDNITEYIVQGGNHEPFAYYGNQSGDGIAKISPETQQKQSIYEIIEFIRGIEG